MTETSSNKTTDGAPLGKVVAWLLFPLALFPLVALLTYDWHAIDALCCPPAPTTNWIGALGDNFAYYGYHIFGLAVWILPFICIVAALCVIHGRKVGRIRRILWFVVFMCAVSSVIQVIGAHTGEVATIAERVNSINPGGAIGYLLMTKALSPLISDFGSAVLMTILLLVSLVGAVGVRNIVNLFKSLVGWATEHDTPGNLPNGPESLKGDEQEQYLAALRAQDEVRRQREAEKQRIREEKEQAKEEKERARAEKQRQKEEKLLAKIEAKRRLQETNAAPAPEPAPVPIPPAIAARMEAKAVAPKPAAKPEDEASAPNDKGPYVLPPLTVLNPLKISAADHSDVDETAQRLVDTLKLFGVDSTVSYTVQGPVVTKYALELAPGTRYTTVTGLSDNLMGALRAKSLRIEAPIPGEDRVGIEVPNRAPAGISFREIFESDVWKNSKAELPLLFGKRADGKELVADLASMPHMLVAGATGQGKSVCLNSIISGLLMSRTPEQLKLIMVDPKCVEFTPYASIPHLLVPVITDNRKVVFSLHWAVAEMEKRLKMFSRAHVKNIYDFNHRKCLTQTDMFGNDTALGSDMPKTVPYIVIIIDEAADLIGQCGKDVNPDIQRITQKARAAGIHLILATQRPDAKIITGAIKANIPGRVAFKTASSVDSRTILDDTGAENLIGRGDMLFRGKDGLLIRAQGAWISDDEINGITAFIEQHSDTQFDEKFATKLGRVKEAAIDDPFASNEDDPDNQPQSREDAQAARDQVKADAAASDFKKAIECVINTNRASTSHFQRQMGWGYNHAAKILDMLEARGIVAPQSGAGPRQIVMDHDQLKAIFNEEGDRANGDAENPESGNDAGTSDDSDASEIQEEQS